MRKKLDKFIYILMAFLVLSFFTCPIARALEDEKPDLEIVKVSAAGMRIPLKIYRDEDGNILIPISDADSGQLMKKFGLNLTYLVPMKTIVMGASGGKDLRIKIGEKKGTYGGKPIELKTAVRKINGIPFIPLECFQVIYKLDISYNRATRILYMDPVITDISFKMVKGKIKLIIEGSAPLEFKTSMMSEPDRYVIDIDNVVPDKSLVAKDLRHKHVGAIFMSRSSRMPNRVRIVIPMFNEVEIEVNQEKKNRNLITTHFFFPKVVAPVQGLERQQVAKFDLKEESDRIIFDINTSGPVQYEWRRLLPPDNRYFIDIPNTKLGTSEYKKKLDVGYISGIEVRQTKSEPDPVVRITLKLEVPCKVEITPDEDRPGVIRVIVYKETIDPMITYRQGFGVTRFPKKSGKVGGLIICIDPGHGGGDPGAVNRAYGLMEKDVTLDISLRLASMLRKAGWNVVMTRTTDRDVSFAGSSDARELGDRVRVANNIGAQVFISIHINASTSSAVHGTSTHCCKSIDYPLARCIQQHLVASNGRRNIGVRTNRFYMVRHSYMPASLVECAFISNPTEASLLRTGWFRQKCAEGIYNGLMAYAQMQGLTGSGEGSHSDSVEDRELKRKIEAEKRKLERELKDMPSLPDPDYSER
ncbi:MAG: N-acetylmuramoyl-L-alanine amidase family protein [Candidatus Eremiobacteraeota bacterium]|nr:N-acetylmuramoyl-L-alanine amidase family protein [Candidatus Eremiobacteraeota bacterium]